jgi:thiol-disulfide isomerase/thioredoxin
MSNVLNKFLTTCLATIGLFLGFVGSVHATTAQVPSDLIAPWRVSTTFQDRHRVLVIEGAQSSGDEAIALKARYGFQDASLLSTPVVMSGFGGVIEISFTTRAENQVTVKQVSPTRFEGWSISSKGKSTQVVMEKLSAIPDTVTNMGRQRRNQSTTSNTTASSNTNSSNASAPSIAGAPAVAEKPAPMAIPTSGIPDIHFVYMGGSDCPSCLSWKAIEVPKLEKLPAFKAVKFTVVDKVVASPVPPAFFLPAPLKPYKEVLDVANGGNRGSPQFAVLVNGKVVDYYVGGRSAEEIEETLAALLNGQKPKMPGCAKRAKVTWFCLEPS